MIRRFRVKSGFLDSIKIDKWDQRYLQLAELVASWSKDPSAKVGAVIADKSGRVFSLGYNGFPIGITDSVERLQNKEVKNKFVVHAEQNALLFAGRLAKNCRIYIVGKPVCVRCAVLIIQAGIKKVVTMHPDAESSGTWKSSGLDALKLFHESGIEVRFCEKKDGESKFRFLASSKQ
jgi:dCMP deaminase